MANLTREAQLALHRQADEYMLEKQHLQREAAENHTAQSLRVSQLEMALELQENKTVQILAQRGTGAGRAGRLRLARRLQPRAQFSRQR